MSVAFDLDLSGFSTGAIDLILSDAPDPDNEPIPAVPEVPRTQLGDIRELGDQRIGGGDARDLNCPRNFIGEAQLDAAFLDPCGKAAITAHTNLNHRHREFGLVSGKMHAPEFQALPPAKP